MSRKGLFTLLLFLSVLAEGWGQAFYAVRRDHDLIVSGGFGSSTYLGEFQNPGDNFDTKPSINIGAKILPAPNFLDNRLSTRAEITWFYLKGSDAKADDDRVERNLSFKSSNWELSTVGMLHLFPQDKKFYQRKFFNIYGFTGMGLLFMNPKAELNGVNYALQPLQTEGKKYSRFQFVVPYGIGATFRQGVLYSISVEAGWRKTFTDYMDDASGRGYADPQDLTSDLARALADRRRERDPNYPVPPGKGVRGNPENYDSYWLLNIKLEYYLPVDLWTDSNRLMTIRRKRK